jgi:N-acetylglutamate synthase-like GNAT family acetyltransferase
MNNPSHGIAEVTEDNNFQTISQLLEDNTNRFLGIKIISTRHTAEALRSNYCSGDPYSKGFIFEDNGTVVAFAGVTPLQSSKNGIIWDWFALENHEHVLNGLIEQCSQVIRQRGGQKIFASTLTKFGQIRNERITFWERLGFISDEYSSATTTLNLEDWHEPDEFDNSNIQPAVDRDIEDVIRILVEDEEYGIAEIFLDPDFPKERGDHIILTMRAKDTDEILGIAKYRVNLFNAGTNNEYFSASGFATHLRPKFNPDRNQHRRIIQASLFSMKQLNIKIAVTHITLKNFDAFGAMIMEGFHNDDFKEHHSVRLYKSLNPL